MTALGAGCGILLSIASRVFYVYEDPRIAQVEACFAGANCGGCGFAGCSAAAAAVVHGKTKPSVCVVGGMESAQKAAAVMGMEVGSLEPLKSFNPCTGGDRAENKFFYIGVATCQAEAALFSGKRTCEVGCIGHGDCVRACMFDAIAVGPDGFPIVDEEKCVGCGACARACPKNLLKISTPSERLLHFNQRGDCLAPCRQTCPAEIDIPLYIHQIRTGDYAGAVNTIRERNPLLLACGRVCPHPCELNCRRGVADEPVSINQLKRFAADFEMTSGRRLPIRVAPDTGKRIAVIGGGPAGLTCAYFLRRLGHSVTIFEAMPKLGGMLRYGIPEYRLPKQVLDWEIESILNLRCRFHGHRRLEGQQACGPRRGVAGLLHRHRFPGPARLRGKAGHQAGGRRHRRRQHGDRLYAQPAAIWGPQGLSGLPPDAQGNACQRGRSRSGGTRGCGADFPERPGARGRKRPGSCDAFGIPAHGARRTRRQRPAAARPTW